MKISISGKNLEVSDYMREVAEKKLSKLSRYFPQDTEAQVTLSVERNRHIVEVTIPYEGRILRGEEVSGDMYASLDSVGSKLEKQVERYRTRAAKAQRNTDPLAEAPAPMEEEEEDQGPHIVRNKKFEIRPMSEEEAMPSSCLKTPQRVRSTFFISARTVTTALLSPHKSFCKRGLRFSQSPF